MSNVKINETVLDNKFTELEALRQWSPRVISRLETMISGNDDFELFRINPIQYSTEKNIPEREAIDLFIYGAKVGLFEMEWHLTCVYCGTMVESFRDLADIYTHFGCRVCSSLNDVALDDYIQVSFTISPQIRDILFRHPGELSAEDFYLKYSLSKGILPNDKGVEFYDLLRQMTKKFVDLEANSIVSTEFDLGPGLLQIRDTANNSSVSFLIGEKVNDETSVISLNLMEKEFQANDRKLEPMELQMDMCTVQLAQVGQMTASTTRIELENKSDKKRPIWIIHYPPDHKPTYKKLAPFLSGKKLLTTQTFRDLFRSELVSGSEGIAVKDITFLFTDLKGSTDMYDRIGDLKAYALVRQHFVTLSHVIDQNSGSIVKTIGDAVMATFMNPVDALNTAIEMLRDIEELNHNISDDLVLKIGIHSGPSIVVTLNDRLDYFGQTVNIAARVQGLAGANEIYLSSDAQNAPGVKDVLKSYDVSSEKVQIRNLTVSYDTHYQTKNLFGNPYSELIDFFKKYPTNGKVLDVGCGQGRDSIAIAQLGYEVVGIDHSAVGIHQMNDIGCEQGLKLRGLVKDIYAFEDFDKYEYILFDSLFHFLKKDKLKETSLVKKAANSAKPGCLLIFCVPDKVQIIKSLREAIDSVIGIKVVSEASFEFIWKDVGSGHKSTTNYKMIVFEK